MGDSAVRRYWIYSRPRQEKLDFDQLPSDTIPAHKAGGRALYGAGPAVFEWFTLEDDPIGVLDNDKFCEETECGSMAAPTTISAEAIAELTGYTDVTLQIYDRLLEAERLATPEDFRGITYDMGFPVGYVRILHKIWEKQKR